MVRRPTPSAPSPASASRGARFAAALFAALFVATVLPAAPAWAVASGPRQDAAGPAPVQQPPAPLPFAVPDPGERGEALAVPMVAADGGPLFALAPIVGRLGGRLEALAGDSWSLTLGEREILFGPEISTLAIGTDIVPLAQPPRLVEDQIYVPIDFLAATYGRFTDYDLRWDPQRRVLQLARRQQRTLTVTTDVVHLQGVTTVVLEFSQRPRYHVEQRALGLDVVVEGAELAAGGLRRVDDPLVDGIRIGSERIALDLEPGASADSYTLDNPFRLVFDVVAGDGGPSTGGPGPSRDTGAAPPALERPRPPEGIRTIVLDPGHGGSETGAIGPSGVQEKELTLLLARSLKARLESALGVRVVLTRDEDANLPHETRTAIANQNKADLFVSLHLNSAFGPSAHGAETYFLSATASDERAAKAAELENQAAVPGGGEPQGDDPLYDLQLMLWDLAQTHFLEQSQRLATLIQGELNSALDLRDRGVKQAPFVVLMGAAMPAVLVEVGFISNPEEERRLQDPAYRAELTDALVRAIGRYKREVEATGGGEPR
jgi:N-acetylmuramoyl-L-alanine amidase